MAKINIATELKNPMAVALKKAYLTQMKMIQEIIWVQLELLLSKWLKRRFDYVAQLILLMHSNKKNKVITNNVKLNYKIT